MARTRPCESVIVSFVPALVQAALRPAPTKVASAFSTSRREVPLPALMPDKLEIFGTPPTLMVNVIVAVMLAVLTLKTAVEETTVLPLVMLTAV